jgi:hypothetical protein
MAGAQLLFTHVPLMNRLFHSAPLDAFAWLRVAAVGVIAFLLVELEKWLRLKFGHEETVVGQHTAEQGARGE